jgi:hypothetical protein
MGTIADLSEDKTESNHQKEAPRRAGENSSEKRQA